MREKALFMPPWPFQPNSINYYKEELQCNAVGRESFRGRFSSPRDSLRGVGSGQSCCILIVKWFQEWELACRQRVLKDTKRRWGEAGLGGGRGKRKHEGQGVAKDSVSCQSSRSEKEMHLELKKKSHTKSKEYMPYKTKEMWIEVWKLPWYPFKEWLCVVNKQELSFINCWLYKCLSDRSVSTSHLCAFLRKLLLLMPDAR